MLRLLKTTSAVVVSLASLGLLASVVQAGHGGSAAIAQEHNATPKRPTVSPRPGSGSSKPQQFSTIYFKNNCNRPLQVAVYFKDISNKWQKKAWYSFAPKEGPARLSGVNTRNRYLYYYAESTDGSDLVWQGNFSSYINNRLYSLQEINTGPSIARWTQTLSCAQTTATKSNKTLLLAQATKEPVANQQSPEELPPVVPVNSQEPPAVMDKPKEEVQKAPASPTALPPAKGEVDAAVVDEESPSAPTPEASPAPIPTSTPEASPAPIPTSTPEASPAPIPTSTPEESKPAN